MRRASEREHSQHLLTQEKPWTFENITKTIVLGQYRDISGEEFPDTEEGPVQEEVVEEEMPQALEEVPRKGPQEKEPKETASDTVRKAVPALT